MKKVSAVLLVLFFCAGASAADFSALVVDQLGKPIYATEDKTKPLTLGTIASQALFGTYPDEQNLGEQEKFTRGQLGLKIISATKPIDLTAEETALIKKLIGKGYSPLIVARTWPMLDPAAR